MGRAIATALEAGFSPVLVVVGAEASAVQAAIASQRVIVVQNSNWQRGMGSSIAAGVRQLRAEATDVAGVAILLADQPLVIARHLVDMRTELYAAGALVVAAEYSGTVGVPALFRRELFSALQALSPDAGAKQLFRQPDLNIARFPLPQAAIDIDTPEDLADLQASAS